MSEFVYMNLNNYPVHIRDNYGAPFTVPTNKGVRGEFFARFALPAGPLSMVHISQVAPDAIVLEVTPKDERTAAIWTDQAKKSDPMLVQLPVVTVEAQEEPEAAVTETPAETPAVTDAPAEEPKKKGGRKKKETPAE